MAINVNSNFHLGSKMFVDDRQSVETLDDLLALDTNIIPNGFECYVEALDCKYKYHEDYNESDTGHWKLNASEGGTAITIDNKIDTSSTNPVQNKVLAQEIARAENGKQYLKITGPMPGGLGYLYARTISDAIENGSALNYQGVDIETVETNIKDNFYDILYRYTNAGDRKYTAKDGLSLSVVPQDSCIIFEAEDVPSGIDKYEVILEWFEPPFVTIYSSEKEFDPIVGEEESDYNFYDLTNLEDSLTSIFNDMKIKSEFNIKNHNFGFDLNKDGDMETLKVNSYKLQKDFAGNGILTVELEDGRILTSTRPNGRYPSWSNWNIVATTDSKALVTNAQNFKLDITKNNSVWYGMFTFNFVYGTTPCEITVAITDKVYYTITKGQNVVSAITYTQDGANYTFGIDFTAKIYGTQVVEMPTEFGVVNSFTAETFAGDTTAICKGSYSMKSYSTLAELGLDTTATINDIIGAMADESVFTYKTDVFDYATEYNNIQYGTVTINKQSDGRAQVLMTDKNTGNLYVGRMDTTNHIIGWRNESFHRAVAQATAGYFKFKPTSDGGFDQSLRISATDNYGGMIEISGNSPSQDQYKPFKCVRLSNGTYASYDAANTTNNKMKKLYLYDGYMYLQVETYTTVTFTGLIEAPTFVETLADTSTEIPIVSLVNPSIKAAAGSNINSVGTPSVTASESNGTTTFTFNYLKGAKGDKGDTGANGTNGTTPTIKAAAGSNINTVGTPSVTASTSGTTTTFTFNNLKGAKGDKGDAGSNGTNGTTPTIKANAGSNIGSVGTPSVTASTSGTTTTFTFNYLKGAKGDKGDKGDTGATGATGPAGYKRFPSTPGVTTTTGVICSLEAKKVVVLYCIHSGGGSLAATSYPSGLTFNGSAWSSGTKSISLGNIYTIANTSSNSTTIKIDNNGGGGFLVFGPMS